LSSPEAFKRAFSSLSFVACFLSGVVADLGAPASPLGTNGFYVAVQALSEHSTIFGSAIMRHKPIAMKKWNEKID